MFFVKIPPHSTFERGIFIPFATVDEAESQIANDLLSTDFILGVVSAEYNPDKYGNLEHVRDYPQHVHKHKMEVDLASIKKRQGEIREKSTQLAVVAQEKLLKEVSLLREGWAHYGSFDKLPEELKNIARRHGKEPMAVAGRPGFCVVTGGTATAGAVALAAATAKTVLGIASGTVGAPAIVEYAISFDGITASAVPVLCELVSGTNATNAPGTASTSMTPKQIRGWSMGAASSTAAYNWTSEPTVLEVFKKRLISPNGGTVIMQQPLDREPAAVVTAATQFKFVGIRLTAPAIVNVHIDAEFDE